MIEILEVIRDHLVGQGYCVTATPPHYPIVLWVGWAGNQVAICVDVDRVGLAQFVGDTWAWGPLSDLGAIERVEAFVVEKLGVPVR